MTIVNNLIENLVIDLDDWSCDSCDELFSHNCNWSRVITAIGKQETIKIITEKSKNWDKKIESFEWTLSHMEEILESWETYCESYQILVCGIGLLVWEDNTHILCKFTQILQIFLMVTLFNQQLLL